jgi:hypothetical protein
MKFSSLIFNYILPLNLLLCASLCCPEEDDPIQISIKNDSIISVANNQNTFALDDTLIIETTIENSQVSTDNQHITLTNYFYLDSPESIFLIHNLQLYKESNFGNIVSIPISSENIEVFEGSVLADDNTRFPKLEIKNIYNQTALKSRFGIQLKERGVFYLSSTQLTNGGLISISGGVYEKGLITINTHIINANTNGLYRFVVN